VGDVLSQTEIESLLAGLPRADAGEDELGGAPAPAAPGKTRVVREYNFRSPNKFSRDQLRALQMIHEALGRQISTAFAATLRSPVHFDVVSTQQLPYQEFMDLLTQSIIYIFSAPPLEGPMLLELQQGLGLCFLERLLGGAGAMAGEVDRALTEIERTILQGVAERVLDAMATAWGTMVDIRPRIEGTETDPQFVQIGQAADTIVAVLFEAKIGDQTGTMNLCVPCVTLEPIASKLSAQQWLTSTRRPPTQESVTALQERLQDAPTNLTVVVGNAQLTIGELAGLQLGDVIRLDTPAGAPIAMNVAGRQKFTVRPGLSGRRMAVRVAAVTEDNEEEEDSP